MLITAEEKEGAIKRSGCTAVFVSDDVKIWSHYKTLYAPRTFITHECHDIFKIGDWWYLVFSNYSRWWETRYRMAEDFCGAWIVPASDDMFDGREFYAAKTVTNGERRFLVGWQAVRKDCRDDEKCIWGGNLLVHELKQREDGTLGVCMISEIRNSFEKNLPYHVTGRQGVWNHIGVLEGGAEDGFGWAELGALKDTCLFETSIEWTEGTRAAGIMIHTDSEKLEKWCQLRLEITHGKICMDRYNRVDGDQSYMDERPFHFKNNRVDIKLLVSGCIMLVYVDDIALTTRCYDAATGFIGVFAEYGSIKCFGIKLLEQ